jgi:serine/threonine-protein kinase
MTSESDHRGTAETAPDVRDSSERDDLELPPHGYVLGAPLGQGGMGEVLLAHDRRIDRPVAFKRMRLDEPTRHEVVRFLREAKIQARLEHPAIVPVYDIGRDPDGRPYFAMRRLSGRTLDACIKDGEPLRRLLRAFVEVCLAVQFAHERETIHRDLKPANIMLGEYGEVYIIDWGVARVLGDEPRPSIPTLDSLDGHTEAGALLGTPGYMAPEQARGEQVGAAADVYALGAILFEVLTGQRLHVRDAVAPNLVASTLARPTQSPAGREPERGIAPELDAACVAALAEDAAARPTARGLADRVQRYLDGDRDLERRRTLAAEQLALARAALASGAPERRGEAMRAAGHALALEPSSPGAAALVTQLMLEPPPALPPALAVHLDELDRDVGARTSHLAAVALLAFVAFIPVLVLDGVKSWPIFFSAYALIIAQIIFAEWAYRKRRPGVVSVLVSTIVLMVFVSRLWSPLIFLPAYINTVAITVGLQPRAIARPWMMVGFAMVAYALPFALEAAGVLEPSWTVANDQIAIHSPGVELGNAWSLVLLLGGNLVLVCVNALFGNSIAATRHDAQRKLAIQAWHLRQLLPA